MFISDDLFLGAFSDLTEEAMCVPLAEELIMGEAGTKVLVCYGKIVVCGSCLYP